jgi:hypothetical protein
MRFPWQRWRRLQRPDEAELEDAIREGRAVAAPRGAVRDLFAEIASRDLEGFERCAPGRWVAPLGEGDFRVLEMWAMKGSAYTLAWGVSLGYVPRLAAAGPRFHRTPKAARLDLHEVATEGDEADIPVCTATWRTRPDGGWWLPDDIRALWASCAPAARSFWERASTPDQVLAVALEQHAAPSIGHEPAPLLVAAFAAARADEPARGEELLERALEERPDTPADTARRGMARVAHAG